MVSLSHYSQKRYLFLGSVNYLKTTSQVTLCSVITDVDDIMIKQQFKSVWNCNDFEINCHLTTAKLCSIIQLKNLELSISRSTGQVKCDKVTKDVCHHCHWGIQMLHKSKKSSLIQTTYLQHLTKSMQVGSRCPQKICYCSREKKAPKFRCPFAMSPLQRCCEQAKRNPKTWILQILIFALRSTGLLQRHSTHTAI